MGNPTSFWLSGGQAHDLAGADVLLPKLQAQSVIADRAYDADERVRHRLARRGQRAVIPSRSTRKNPCAYDRELYKARHLN
ncbi:MAG: hypothetical protein AAF889_05710 [Cyanobacteria bacterium P01_D01_bin.73]